MDDKYIDLHTHSTCSDGTLRPGEVVRAAAAAGLSAMALTDHDTVAGLDEEFAAGREIGLRTVTGIEFSVGQGVEMHMLGLNFSLACPAIREKTAFLLRSRDERNKKTIALLRENGIDITEEDMLAEATSAVVGRSQIARAMIKKGYVRTVREAFKDYLSLGRPTYVPRRALGAEETIELIHADGGKAILAHLNQIVLPDDDKYATLVRLKEAGLDGIEGYYTEYTDSQGERYREWARQLGLILSGGSDFHGKNKEDHEIGIGRGDLRVPYELLEDILECGA